MKQLDITKIQDVQYCVGIPLRDEQIRINLSKVKGRVEPREKVNEPIAVVAFAPSLRQMWKQIKKFKNVMTCSGAHAFLVEKGIIPTFHLDLDPRIHKLKLLGPPQKETQYLIASTVHPQYLDALKGFDVKLWHIFANEEDGARVLPRGEWAVTGGSSVGLRCLTMARFLGYTDIHVFGMDGSFTKENTHTTKHPNAPKEAYETEYEGKKYLTTPSMLHVAKETFHELDQMPDCTFKFYGLGLVQAMAKKYVSTPSHGNAIAFNKPELISKEYIEQNQQLHRDIPTYGMGGDKHKDVVLKLSKSLKTTSILDYGAGKQMLAKSLDFPIWSYDPAIPEIAAPPKPADIVVCTDTLEHIEPDKLKFVLDDIRFCMKQVGYLVISTRKAVKTYPNGQNAHLIVQGKDWWSKQLSKFFDVAKIVEKDDELHVVVGPKQIVVPDTVVVEQNGIQASFLTPNDTTKWRAKTLLTKEPITIDWLNGIPKDAVLYDVGANVGGYSIWAGIRGVKVISFEPEAENYAMLTQNINLNNLDVTAYCLAVSDKERLDVLHMSGRGVGSSCHSFGKAVDAFGAVRNGNHPTQAALGMSIDALVKKGLPKPEYIKIDVDGFEPQVIKGAVKTLASVKSLIVEVNPSLPSHLEMVKKLTDSGFSYDQTQVDNSTRAEGPFKGVAEYVFTRPSETEQHILNAIGSTKVIPTPFPHLYIENILPDATYKDLLESLPKDYVPIKKSRGLRGYPQRFTAELRPEWIGCLKDALCNKFGVEGNTDETLLIRDKIGYEIGPHTDNPRKVMSALFYLAKEGDDESLGTSLYVPKKKGFTCKGGPHYSFEKFEKVQTAAYRPNSLFVFLKSDVSFHGVEKTAGERDVLLYDIQRKI